MTFRMLIRIAVITVTGFFTGIAAADESVTVATWNVGFVDRNANNLQLNRFLQEVDFDILLVNEIKTQSDLDRLKAAMNRSRFFTAISSFDNDRDSLEVGIISRFPLSEITEFDQSPNNFRSTIAEKRLRRVNSPGLANVSTGRGFLVAKVAALNMYVIVSHFKSSRGAVGFEDRVNAQKRESVAAAVAQHVADLRRRNPQATVLFGGDVNVGVTDRAKNGTKLTDDSRDGYDDTHALLSGGLISGVRMRSLAAEVDSTYVGRDNVPDHPGTGAIDVLYVTGPMAGQFGPAQAASDRYGSDHLAVFASTGRQATANIRIVNALPDPAGPDEGREQVTIRNDTRAAVRLSGWRLRDRDGNIYAFPAGALLRPGRNDFTMTSGTMPLNNRGDTITLLDDRGIRQGPTFTYSEADVQRGRQVR